MKTLEMPPERTSDVCMKRILVPIDFSALSKKALEYAQQLANHFHADLTLLHVVEPEAPPIFDGYMISAPAPAAVPVTAEKRELRMLASSAQSAGVRQVHSAIRQGLASHEIVDAARDLDVDAIVIGTHGYTGWKHFCIGSTAERVVRAAPCPVLVVREKEHEFITTQCYGEA
jgi:universal stress protein A